MSVYKRNKTSIYSYDFRYQNHRYSGSTGTTTKREAEKFETKLRASLKTNSKIKKVKRGKKAKMTISAACVRYFEEVSQYHAAPDTALADFERIEKIIGKKTKLHEIDNNEVARAVAIRRGHKAKNSQEFVTNGTVNKSLTKRLSAVINRAAKVWNVKTCKINWGEHYLKEPQERVRELSSDEEILFDHMREDYLTFTYFLMYSGARIDEVIKLKWRDFDWRNNEFTVTGKGDKTRTLALSNFLRDLVRALPRVDQEHVFTFVKQRNPNKGERFPITYYGFRREYRNAIAAAKIKDFRIHDFRHTAASRIMREMGNMKLVQKILGHSSIDTTNRYAHVQKSDIADAMEAISPAKSYTKSYTISRKSENKQ